MIDLVGKTISHYKILEKLGEGGMGVVYKAWDTRLKRTVALKFLSPQALQDEVKKTRFFQEAQAAAALNHPNICTIYEIDEVEDKIFIVMEFIEGQNLKQIIRRNLKKALNLHDVLSYAIQITEGLQEAHEKGIIHRDIKSTNIMVTEKGLVKIMDFGLAKISQAEDLTKDGATLGTVAYMSPEQARGERVDEQTDIWSLGVVLYEMLTGQLPFKGENEMAMTFSILDDEPESITALYAEVPAGLERITFNCLEKAKENRYLKTGQLLADLKKLKETIDFHIDIVQPVKQHKRIKVPRKTTAFIFATIIIATAIFLIFHFGLFKGKVTAPRIIRFSALTRTISDFECNAQISPDGNRIAYRSEISGNMDIWVLQIASGEKINLTMDHEGIDHTPRWSPDGNFITFISSRDGGGLYKVSEYGGVAKLVMAVDNYMKFQFFNWSPDGKKLVYAENETLYTVAVNEGIPQHIPLPHNCMEPAWSPDGNRIVYVTGKIPDFQIWTVRSDGSEPIMVYNKPGKYSFPTWSNDGKRIFFKHVRGEMRELWWMPVDKKGLPKAPAKPLTAGVNFYDFSLSHDGTKLAYQGGEGPEGVGGYFNVWSIPLDVDSVLTMQNAVQITEERQDIWHLTLSPDHQWFAFGAVRHGQKDIWLVRRTGQDLRRLTTDSLYERGLCWSPDGSRIAFHQPPAFAGGIYTVPIKGGPVTSLRDHTKGDNYPAWSPDGEKIAFNSERNGNRDVWILSLKDDEVRQLTDDEAHEGFASWSPDGRTIAFWSCQSGSNEIHLIPAEGGEGRQLTQVESTIPMRPIWSPDGKTIYAIYQSAKEDPIRKIITISVADGSAQTIFEFKDRSMGYEIGRLPSLATDGEHLYFIAGYLVGNIMLAELVYE